MLNIVLRCLLAVMVGLLLIIYKDAVMPFIVQFLGVAFMLPGLVSVWLRLMAARDGENPLFSIPMITSLGSVAFGAWLLFAPTFFVAILMSLLGAILLLAGLYHIVILVRLRRYNMRPSLYFYIIPTLTVLLGIFIFINPFEMATLSFILVGVGAVLAGLSDLINWLLLRKIGVDD